MKVNIKRLIWVLILIGLAILFRYFFEFIFDIYSTKYSLTQFLNIVLHFILTGIAVLIFLGILIRSDYSPAKLPWLLVLLFEPFIGLTLF